MSLVPRSAHPRNGDMLVLEHDAFNLRHIRNS
jgi:hypothetical protein